MINCPKCHGEGKVRTLKEESDQVLKVCASVAWRVLMVCATPFVSLGVFIGIARVGHWAIGADPLVRGARYSAYGPDVFEPSMMMQGAGLAGGLIGIILAVLLAFHLVQTHQQQK